MDIDKLIQGSTEIHKQFRFGSLMDIDKLIRFNLCNLRNSGFGSLMDIDKLIHYKCYRFPLFCFGSLMENKNSQSLFRPWEFLLYTIHYPLAQPPQPVQPPVVPNTCSYSF